MLTIMLIIYIILSLLLIIFILINKGNGAEIGATFNSSTNDIFGSKGSNSILNKIIIFIAIMSLIANISINLINKNIKKKNIEPLVNIYEKQINLKKQKINN